MTSAPGKITVGKFLSTFSDYFPSSYHKKSWIVCLIWQLMNVSVIFGRQRMSQVVKQLHDENWGHTMEIAPALTSRRFVLFPLRRNSERKSVRTWTNGKGANRRWQSQVPFGNQGRTYGILPPISLNLQFCHLVATKRGAVTVVLSPVTWIDIYRLCHGLEGWKMRLCCPLCGGTPQRRGS